MSIWPLCLNLRVVGVIVMLAGVIALLLSLLAWGAPKTLRRLRLRDAAARPAAECLPGPAASAKAVAAVTGSPRCARGYLRPRPLGLDEATLR